MFFLDNYVEYDTKAKCLNRSNISAYANWEKAGRILNSYCTLSAKKMLTTEMCLCNCILKDVLTLQPFPFKTSTCKIHIQNKPCSVLNMNKLSVSICSSNFFLIVSDAIFEILKQNQKIPSSKSPTGTWPARLSDPIQLWDSRWISVQKCEKRVINIGWVRLLPKHSDYKIVVSEKAFKQEFLLYFTHQNLFPWEVILKGAKFNWKKYIPLCISLKTAIISGKIL